MRTDSWWRRKILLGHPVQFCQCWMASVLAGGRSYWHNMEKKKRSMPLQSSCSSGPDPVQIAWSTWSRIGCRPCGKWLWQWEMVIVLEWPHKPSCRTWRLSTTIWTRRSHPSDPSSSNLPRLIHLTNHGSGQEKEARPKGAWVVSTDPSLTKGNVGHRTNTTDGAPTILMMIHRGGDQRCQQPTRIGGTGTTNRDSSGPRNQWPYPRYPAFGKMPHIGFLRSSKENCASFCLSFLAWKWQHWPSINWSVRHYYTSHGRQTSTASKSSHNTIHPWSKGVIYW